MTAEPAHEHRGDTPAAVAFLRRYRPGGPWVLTAIPPNGDGRTATATFTEKRADAMASWVESHQGSRNVYFHVGVGRRDSYGKKLDKADVGVVDHLHVDVDAPGVADEAWRARALRALREHVPPPTEVVFSGGGYGAFWRLAEPVRLPDPKAPSWADAVAEVESRNVALSEALGGDHCHDISRLMRLPGTINVPSEKKRGLGRTEALAELVEAREESYELDVFPRSEASEKSIQTSDRVIAVDLPADLPRLDDVRDLDDHTPGIEVSGAVKKTIVEGDYERFGGDRSKAVFWVCCELVRCEVPDEVIGGVITDPRFEISAHVRAQGDVRRYVSRQVGRARDLVAEKTGRARAKPTIIIQEGRLVEVVDAAQDALIAAEAPIFQRGAILVRPCRVADLSGGEREDDVERASEATVLTEVRPTWLVEEMARSANWMKWDGRQKLPKIADPQRRHAQHIIERVGDWPFRPLRGVVHTPTLRADGTILQEPGYDARSKLLYDPAGVDFAEVPVHPTREDALAAIEELRSPFRLFRYTDPAGLSVALSAILTGLIRPSLRSAPLHGFDAPVAGSGKSLQVETVGIIVAGHDVAHISQGKSAEEDEKRLISCLIKGDPIISIDNCDLPVENDTLCSMLTQPMVRGRILGRSEMVSLPSSALVCASGNNLILNGDMSRRAVISRLDPEHERPDERRFPFDPRDEARERRTLLVVAALTCLRAYIAAGRPKRGELEPMGSFEDYALVRETLSWLDQEDPAETRKLVREADTKREELRDLLTTWHETYGERPMTVVQVRDRLSDAMNGGGDFRLWDLLLEMTNRPAWNGRSIGKLLTRHKDRIVTGLRLERYEDTREGARWRVVKVPDQRQLGLGAEA